MNITESFLNSLDEIFAADIPEHVYLRSKKALLDYLAVTVAGAKSQEEKLRCYFRDINPEPGKISTIGIEPKLCLKDAVFLNGLNAHALDLDDGVNEGIIHLASPLFSVLLPLAQKYAVTVNKFLKSVIIGYETAFTIAISIQPKHKELGYHATGTCGVLGIALAVANLLDFSETERNNAFSTACVSATGVLNVLDEGSELKPYNAAKSALLGLIACQMAKAGFNGPIDPLGNERGFLQMMSNDSHTEVKKPLSDGRYAIERTYTKPFAACRYCHPAIEAAINLKQKYNFLIADIESIEVNTYYWAVNKHDHTDIPNSASAKMSIPYGVAIGLIEGKAGLNQYNLDYVHNPLLINLLKKISVTARDEYTNLFPEKTVAYVKVMTKDGKIFDETIDYPKGEPENPLTDEEFEQRFIDLYKYGGKSEADALNTLKYVKNMKYEQDFNYEKIS